MCAIVSRRVRTTQPQQGQIAIDWSNPITAGLVFAYVCGNEAMGYGEDGRNLIQYVNGGGTVTGIRINTPNGTGVQAKSSSSFAFGPTQTSIKSGVYSMFAFGTGTASGIQSAIDDDDGNTRRFQFRINAGKVELNPFYSGGNGNVAAPAALSAYDLANGFAMGAVVNGAAYAIYQKGVKTAGTAMPSTALTPNSQIAIAARKTGTTQAWLVGGLQIVAMWNRALTDAEQASLADNPWQLVKPAPRRMWLAWSPFTGSASTVSPDVAALAISSDAPALQQTANISLSPDLSALSTNGYAPTLNQTANQFISPGGSALAAAAFAPSIAQPIGITPSGAALSLSGSAPSITQLIATIVAPGGNAMPVSAYAPSIVQTANVMLTPGPAALAAAAAAPAIAQGTSQSVQALLATIALTTSAPGVVQAPMPPDPRYAYPIGDISDGAWMPSSGTSLASMINEQTPDDETYISTSSASICRMQLAPVVNPGTTSGQVMRYRAGSSTGNGLYVRLMQGNKLIVQWTHAQLPAQQTTFAQALTAAQCTAITDYSNLFLEFEAF